MYESGDGTTLTDLVGLTIPGAATQGEGAKFKEVQDIVSPQLKVALGATATIELLTPGPNLRPVSE